MVKISPSVFPTEPKLGIAEARSDLFQESLPAESGYLEGKPGLRKVCVVGVGVYGNVGGGQWQARAALIF